MRLSPARILASASLVAFAALAGAQPPPGDGPGAPPPPKQGPPGAGAGDGDGERRPPRRGVRGDAMPDMSPVEPPDMVPPADQPVTGSGNTDLWAERLAARRAAAARGDEETRSVAEELPQFRGEGARRR